MNGLDGCMAVTFYCRRLKSERLGWKRPFWPRPQPWHFRCVDRSGIIDGRKRLLPPALIKHRCRGVLVRRSIGSPCHFRVTICCRGALIARRRRKKLPRSWVGCDEHAKRTTATFTLKLRRRPPTRLETASWSRYQLLN